MVCLALVGNGRRAKISAAQSLHSDSQMSKMSLDDAPCNQRLVAMSSCAFASLKAFATILLAFHPPVAFNVASGHHHHSMMGHISLKFPNPVMRVTDERSLEEKKVDAQEIKKETEEEQERTRASVLDGDSDSGVSAWIQENVLQGVEGSPETYAIMACYLVQGVLGLASLAKTYFMKDEFGLSPAESAALLGITYTPWVIKPVYGFLTDGLPLFGYRRKPYLILGGLLGSVAWASLATVVHTPTDAVIASVFASAGIAITDVVVDSLVVERARDDESASSGALQSLCWSCQAFGGLASAYFSGSLLQTMTPQQVFGITAAFPLVVSAMALQLDEAPVSSSQQPDSGDEPDGQLASFVKLVQEQSTLLWEAISKKELWLPLLFIYLWRATPESGSAFFYFINDDLGVGPEFLGRTRVGSAIASILGIQLYRGYLQEVPFKELFKNLSIVGATIGLFPLLLVFHYNRALGIPDQWFIFGDDVIFSVLNELAHIPSLVLAASLCPPGVEGTLFALLMSGFNAAGILSSELGAGLTSFLGVKGAGPDGQADFSNLGLLIAICNFAGLLPLLALNWLDEVPSGSAKSKSEEGGGVDADAMLG